MITIFNRKQLLMTYDMAVQAKIRDILSINDVEYKLNPIASSYNTSRSSNAEYKFYVKKSDYDKAIFLIRDVFSNN